MVVDVTTEILIERPIALVAAFAIDPDNAPRWYVNIKAADWVTDKPLRHGSRIAFVAHFLGRRMSYVYEVVDVIPERRLVMKTSEGPFPMETTYEFEAVTPTRTRMTLRNRGEPSGFMRWVAPFMQLAMRRANRADLALLRQLLNDDG